MLDTETKRRIDTARDILVGKVPDPKSQVEQITIALIYKFMDDMDAESEELGGKRKFFAGEFTRYGWAKLMRSGLGGHETLNLYSESIAKMPENPGIPKLFRDIFKNAYLPYRDPETLRAFLKIIDDFEYDHSERLGDAFEYLLSVLGSQGDAGQFRTPRHIIDFMVKIVDPKKNESVLDPACGTAGFLISSYKHIMQANTDENSNSTLTPDEKGKLASNFTGYDISPDMVRLSLVNMYLHGFAAPNIYEYDTLTSLDRWNEYADVILANPPFMSPKGGIIPHKRFSMQCKRSEVLFVDYMAEHLTPSGRAGIIVPEGIIFQGGTAYKRLRKMLVDEYLVAVVSLPAGVFNPYSGVKTSILILDKPLAKRTGFIGFFKVENDGFNLGAQRRPIDKNDLPQVQEEIAMYLDRVRSGQSVESDESAHGLIVAKQKIADNGEYNLSGERYHNQTRLTQVQWPIVSLGEICTFMTGGTPKTTVEEYYAGGTIPWLVSGDIHGFEIWDCEKRITQIAVENSNARVLPKDSVLIALNGQGKTRGTVALLRMEGATCNQSLVAMTPANSRRAIVEYIFWTLRSMYAKIRVMTGDAERSGLNIPILKSVTIPLPPLEVQKEIVAEISGYQKVIDGARAVVENYKPHIQVDPEWPMVELGEVLTLQRGYDLPKQLWKEGPYPIVGSNGIIGFHTHYKEDGPGVVTGRSGTIGKVHFIDYDHYWPHNTALFVKDFKDNDPKYAKALLESIDLKTLGERTSAVPSLDRKNAHRVCIPIPPLPTQQAIVAEIEAEQKLINANRELITRMEKKIQDTLARVWGERE